ncbi:hypothetical protein C8J56DRAFT_879613 [Mycena floridula]|nr:hypothetical protein C8J56DRAFT_879613 [Mycena floridula]
MTTIAYQASSVPSRKYQGYHDSWRARLESALRRPQRNAEIPMVLHEEKVCGGLKEWGSWRTNRHAPDGEIIPNSHPDMRKTVPQIRKYSFEHKTPYTMISDGNEHIGLVWEACDDWQCHQSDTSSVFARKYGALAHVKERPHKAKCIYGYNNPGTPDSGKLSARMLLMLLIHLALMDHGILVPINFGNRRQMAPRATNRPGIQ